MRRAGILVALAFAAALAGTAAFAAEPAGPPEPPFQITADNMTGGRGDEGDVLYLNGNLRVVRGRTVLTSDRGRYFRTNGMIFLEGNVRLMDSTTTVTCERATFSETDDKLNLDGDVVIRDREAVLHAPSGWYDRKRGEAKLTGGVRGDEKKQRIEGDEATYLRDSSIVQARGHVKGWDDENKLQLDAAAIDFDRRTRVAVATGDPVLRSTDDEGKVSILRARHLRVDSDNKFAEARDSVVVERDTLRARSDYAFFDDRSERGLLLGSPRAWDQETVVTGDTLEMLTQKRKLQRFVVLGNARMDYRGIRPTTLGETNLLLGNRVDVFVTDNRIDSLRAIGQSRNEYSAPKQRGKTNESNLALGDTILVYFKARKIDRARVQGGANGEYRAPVAEGDTLAARAELVKYDGRRIEYVVPKSEIVLDGDAHLTYRELELNARRVVFDADQQTLVAEGKPELLDKGDRVVGQLMTYDLETRQGTIYQAETKYERGLYHGERIRKVGDNVLDVLNGAYSTCDLDEPHYHFSARWMKIYLKDKLVAKPVVFYLRHIPVLALPFYVFPIKPGRHSGFLFPNFQLGFNNRTGQFLRNAGYYWAPNDYMDLTVAGDYYQAEPSWQLRADTHYKLVYALDGNAYMRFNHNDLTGRDDYTFDADHAQELTPRTRLVARGSFVSSRAFSGSALSGGTLEDRLRRFLVSSVALTHNADWASFGGFVDRRQDLDADAAIADPDGLGPLQGRAPGSFASLPNITESKPSFTVSFPTRTIGSLAPLRDSRLGRSLQTTYFSLSGRYLSYRERTAFVRNYSYFTNGAGQPDSTTVIDQRNVVRRAFSSAGSISDSRRLGGWLTLSPSLSANAVVFDFDELGHDVVPAATWSASMGASTTTYGTFKPTWLGIDGLRHVVFPSVSLFYSPEFPGLVYTDSLGRRQERFRSFGGVGLSGFKSARMNFGLDQRFQVKLRRGDQVTRLDNLLSWSTTGSYNFLWKEQHQKHGLTPLSSGLRLQPPGYVSADLSTAIDIYEGRPLRALGYNVGAQLASGGRKRSGQTAALAVEQGTPSAEIAPDEQFRDTWSLSMSYSYSGGYGGPSWSSQKTANGVLDWKLTPNWQFNYSAAFDLTLQKILTQRFSLVRRLHCWDASFTRTFIPGGEAEYYLRIGVRDQRELYYERGSRVQSFGGIQ